jgi:SAM-dependent methyltransferase
MKNDNELKELVRETYTAIANQPVTENLLSCCGATGCCEDTTSNIMADDYTHLEGYHPDADLGLGCGLPTVFARIKEGDVVVDLGSGAGNDCFVARSVTGEKGKVIGIDFTEKMIEKARANAEQLGFNNVEFRFGDIENIPLTSNRADVVVSNCVLNLVPNKHKVFSEIFRIVKPGGHFSISDIVLEGELPQKLRQAAEMYAGCVSGASQKKDYLDIIHEAGFTSIEVQKEKKITIPDEILAGYLNAEEIAELKNKGTGIYSITVYAEKPSKDDRNCCEPGSGCC